MTEPGSVAPDAGVSYEPSAPAPSERGWGKLLLGLAAFLFIPTQLGALLPVEQSIQLFVPALAACALVGWWAGGRAFLAVAWVALAALMIVPFGSAPTSAFDNLIRGWSLLLAGSFGIICLFGMRRSLLTRALLALILTLTLGLIMSLLGPVTLSQAATIVADEFARRNAASMAALNAIIAAHAKDWSDLSTRMPALAQVPSEVSRNMDALSGAGTAVFPALLALQSLVALALAWATYHRLGRARLGAPLLPLREFRFNDQLVWGLIVGLTILLVPTLGTLRGAGKNLVVFFGALYAVRGFGVLSWFMAPGSLGVSVAVGFVMLLAPVINVFAALALMMLGIAALALGLGDTWADWRRRARPTS